MQTATKIKIDFICINQANQSLTIPIIAECFAHEIRKTIEESKHRLTRAGYSVVSHSYKELSCGSKNM